jgi:hypothetical protein
MVQLQVHQLSDIKPTKTPNSINPKPIVGIRNVQPGPASSAPAS